MTRTYTLIFGVVYAVVALIEVVFREALFGLLHFTPLHAGIHAVAGVALLVAHAKGETWSLLAARVVGPVFLLLFLSWVVAPALLSDILGYPVNWFYSMVHLLSGAFGIYVGFLEKAAPMLPVASHPQPVPPSLPKPPIAV